MKFTTSKIITTEEKIKAFNQQKELDNSDTMLKKKLTFDVMIELDNKNLDKIYNDLKKM